MYPLPSPIHQLAFFLCLFGIFSSIAISIFFLNYTKKEKMNHLNLNNKQTDLPQQQQQPKQRAEQQKYQSQYQRHNQYNNNGLFGNNTQIILDWDDTLFPTAYTYMLLKNGKTFSKQIGSSDRLLLEELKDTVIYMILMFIQLFGAQNICIVTNAERNWLNRSCFMYKRLYSQVRDLIINKYNISVISAHDSYKREKSLAFMSVLADKYNINKVICIGDSNEEYDAIHNVCYTLRADAKRSINYFRVKLLETPSLSAMIGELNSIKTLDYNTISKQQYNESYHFK